LSVPICAIDPGYGGGIAFYANESTVLAAPMPRENIEFSEYVLFLKETYGPFMVLIEKVNVWRGDNATPGKQFGIEKMLKNYSSLVAILEVHGLPVVEVASISWQKGLDLYLPKTSKTVRKNLYKKFATKKYPTLKPTLKTADALCILSFGRMKAAIAPKWLLDRVKNKQAASLFSHG